MMYAPISNGDNPSLQEIPHSQDLKVKICMRHFLRDILPSQDVTLSFLKFAQQSVPYCLSIIHSLATTTLDCFH